MLWIYNIGIQLYALILGIVSVFNNKAKLFVKGREHIFEILSKKVSATDRPIWFHFASLGEFEQGRPVLEKLKEQDPQQKIIVTFFSPSGYEIRKNYTLADVFYLPLDTPSNAKKFIDIVKPKAAVFTKYEFWFHYFKQLHHQQIPLYLISGIFRPQQVFFKWYGGFYRQVLTYVSHFFVQNEESLMLLKEIGIDKVTLSGDTRFDRVYENAQHPKKIVEVERFCGDSPILIAGSTWLEDEKLLANLVVQYPNWKFIIAPHEIGHTRIEENLRLFPNAIRFSQRQLAPEQTDSNVLIIDNIGMLSSLYQYGRVAYIGGGFGVGIHNTLEAAAFGLPVIFGPKYDKFQEAKALIAIGAAASVSNEAQLLSVFESFKDNEAAPAAAKNYVNENKGASAIILTHLSEAAI